MRELWEYVQDRWEWDSVWKDQILLTVIVGAIGLAFALAEVSIKTAVPRG